MSRHSDKVFEHFTRRSFSETHSQKSQSDGMYMPTPNTSAVQRTLAALVLVLGLSLPVQAQDASETVAADGKVVIQLLIYGEDACPQTNSEEIVVCARRPESERYRIPKKLREKGLDESGDGGSWTTHNEGLEASSRFTRPNSCSAVGSGGQTGCLAAALHQWYLERQLDKRNQP